MSSLIPFENRHPVDLSAETTLGSPAPIVEVSAHRGRARSASTARSRRRMRPVTWDPAFHVDLLTF